MIKRTIQVGLVVSLFVIGSRLSTAQPDDSTPTASPTLADTPTITPTPGIPEDILNRINILRASVNIPPLALSDKLTAAANAHARWMADTGEVNHTQPDGSRPADRALVAGYESLWCCGENIYMGMSPQPDDAWEFWIHSQLHYANLTSERYRELGVGVATAPSEYGTRTAFVLVFGMPTNATPMPFTPQPRAETSHVVQQGETLFSIASRYGVTVRLITDANGIVNPDVLEVGQVLIIPGNITGTPPAPLPTRIPSLVPSPTLVIIPSVLPALTPSSTALYRTHVVQRGENLFRIALKYGVSMDALIAANDITDPTRIYVGQTLIIP